MSGKYSKPVYVLDIPWQIFDLTIAVVLAFLASMHLYGHMLGGLLGHAITFVTGIGFLTIVYGSFIEPRWLKVKRYSVGVGSRTLKVAFISDIHVGPYKKTAWVRKVVEKTNALGADVVLLGGDFLYKKAAALPFLEPFKELGAPLGVYAILGNHDEWKARQESLAWFSATGIPLLHNRSVRVEKDGAPIVIAGAEDDWYGETDLTATLRGITPNDVAIVMLHNPDLARPAEELLSLGAHARTFFFSGHTHGGQIRLPFWGNVMRLPHHLGRKFDRGIFNVGGVTLVIGAGAGESGPRARLFCRPEIVLTDVKF